MLPIIGRLGIEAKRTRVWALEGMGRPPELPPGVPLPVRGVKSLQRHNLLTVDVSRHGLAGT